MSSVYTRVGMCIECEEANEVTSVAWMDTWLAVGMVDGAVRICTVTSGVCGGSFTATSCSARLPSSKIFNRMDYYCVRIGRVSEWVYLVLLFIRIRGSCEEENDCVHCDV